MQLKKDDESGEFTGGFMAVFATLNVEDLDGDVTIPGAFEAGQEVIVEPWNHGWTLPAGMGVIQADEEKAWIDGNFFLDTDVGKQNYQTVKNLGGLAQWSYTFDVVDEGKGEFEERQVNYLRTLDVVGVSPVTRGAGIDTRTVNIKEKKKDLSSDDGEDEAPSAGSGQGSGQADEGKSSGVAPMLMRTRIDLLAIELEA